jgi:hypothetical protein
MTNLLFSIVTVLVTNVTEATNERYEQYPGPCPEGRIGCGVMHGWVQGPKIAEATERTVTTTYRRVTNAVCAEPLVPSMLLGSCELSNHVEVFERQWVPRTNYVSDAKPVAANDYASTNRYSIQWNSNGLWFNVRTNISLFRNPTNTLELR